MSRARAVLSRLVVAPAACAALLVATAPRAAETPPAAASAAAERPVETTWDLNVEGAVGRALLSPAETTGFGRVRAGLLRFDQSDRGAPTFLALGLAYDLSDRSPGTFFVQGEVLSLSSGLWLQLGAGLDVEPRPAFMGSVGWSLFGVEGQARWDDMQGAFFALYGKLRVPISVIVHATR